MPHIDIAFLSAVEFSHAERGAISLAARTARIYVKQVEFGPITEATQ